MDQQAFAQLLGNHGEFLGAVAVVITLLYLSMQVRHSNLARSIEREGRVAITPPAQASSSPIWPYGRRQHAKYFFKDAFTGHAVEAAAEKLQQQEPGTTL